MRRQAMGCSFGRRGADAAVRLAIASMAILLILLAAVPSAQAAVVTDRPLLFTFDGSDSSIDGFDRLNALAADNETGDLYAINLAGSGQGTGPLQEPTRRVVCKFDSEGNAKDFAALGKSCLDGSETPGGAFGVDGFFGLGAFYVDVGADNSGGSTQGRLYVQEGGGPVHVFAPSGVYLCTLPRKDGGGNPLVDDAVGITVDAAGHLWVSSGSEVRKFANTGCPPALLDPIAITSGNKSPWRLAVDDSGEDLYVALSPFLSGAGKGVHRYDTVTKAFDPPALTDTPTRALAIDQTNPAGHLFGVQGESSAPLSPFAEYDATGAELGSFGGDLIGDGFGIAYSPALDRVYVADRASNSIKAFGPAETGTVPDVAIAATTEVGQNKAKANGTVNPQGVANAYFFEFKQGSGVSWATAQSSPPQSIEPTDSASHAVSGEIAGLKANTTYQVRLVGENTENDLRAYSTPDTFTTLPPPSPIVEDLETSAITSSSAHVKATIDPQEDQTTWKVLRASRLGATQAECEALAESQFTKVKEATIPSETPGSVEVEADLTGLLPAQTNCVRVSAANGNPIPGVADGVFRTEAVAPSEVETAFVAPRTDTTARLNAWVNPEGEADFSYRFELSEDGANWTALADEEDDLNAREKILVDYELSGLSPNTTYHYRLAAASNEAGSAPGLPTEARSFTTRTTAEVTLPAPRGIELVSNPDKGNQDVNAWIPSRVRPNSADGERMLWSVWGGAPDANSGSGAVFLAKRTASGWRSSSLIPPPDRQIGGGSMAYQLRDATPDLTKFAFQAALVDVFVEGEATMLRLDESQNQEALQTWTGPQTHDGVQMTHDGSHVVLVEIGSPDDLGGPAQLVDIGGGSREVLSIMPDGTPSACGLSPGESFSGNSANANAAGGQWRGGYYRIAATDASRAYFQAMPNGECNGRWGIYVRNRETKKTTLIDPGAGDRHPSLIRATPDGRRAYFVTDSQLDPADKNANGDVYRWDEKAAQSRCLTCEAHPDVELAPGVGGSYEAVMVSDDFSHIYLLSYRQLIPGQGRESRQGQGHNLYVLSGGTLRFIATTNRDGNSVFMAFSDYGRLSRDGNALLIESKGQLTADAIASSCPPLNPELEKGGCQQLYLYDDRDGSLECLSCRRGGTTTHNVGFPATGLAGILPTPAAEISADGGTVAFGTNEALLRRDVNQGTDIYEWRNGSLRLITDGVSDYGEGLSGPRVWGVDEDGSDIFFSAISPGLTGYEQDRVSNLYDARIGGGFARPTSPGHCTEDSCQGPLQAAPSLDQPASSRAGGRGNVAERASKKRSCARKRGAAKRRCLQKKKRSCARKRGAAKRRCLQKHRKRSRKASAQANARRAK